MLTVTSSHKTGALVLKWRPPVPSNGIIKHYEVCFRQVYEDNTPVQKQQKCEIVGNILTHTSSELGLYVL